MDIHRLIDVVILPFRRRRMGRLLATMAPMGTDPVLDVGGTAYNWKLVGYRGPVVLLNLADAHGDASAPNLQTVTGDGCDLPYADASFDLVHSNSVIEHVGSIDRQRRFAQEVRRVGRRLWVQTPAREFFLEPHYLTPFVHWLPKAWQKRLLRNFSIWGWMARPSPEYVAGFVDQTRLLSLREMQELFPDCVILRERFLFMTKAYIAVRTA